MVTLDVPQIKLICTAVTKHFVLICILLCTLYSMCELFLLNLRIMCRHLMTLLSIVKTC